ncbi:MAG: hypothetical protein IT385_23925 [Deltaproteobacteria bacterium]|nr:hypothetical protein [Deltaproteobacteria bacterium]
MRPVFASLLLLAALAAPAAHAAGPTAPPYGLPRLERADFTRLAPLAGLPLFWRSDAAGPGDVDPSELAVLGDAPIKRWVSPGKKGKDGLVGPPTFTRDFEKGYRALVELRRREAVQRELAQGRPTLVETDLSQATDEERAIVKSLATAAKQIDELFELQIGAAGLAAKIPRDDLASRALIARNHGPWCEAPLTEADPFCNAVPTFPTQVTYSWPPTEKHDAAFCARIAAEPNAAELTTPFTIVRAKRKGGYEAIPYTKAYARQMKAIARTLAATAKLVKNPDEAPFKAYLLAASRAFETNDWPAADEAWSAMSAENSRFYLRIAPDETYWDPCGLKSGFHMSFALVDKTALAWKAKLTGVRGDLEKALAALIGPPYAARDVSFELPEFIEIIVNGGDSRTGLGATVGQSLPNFGKVADESRGRTVAMVNIYTDADSLSDISARDRSLFTESTVVYSTDDPAVERLGTVLHEATHNLGPYGSTKIDGKGPTDIFGGKIDSVLEELKAQTGALFFLPRLAQKGFIDQDGVRQGWVGSLSWGFGHIARGMFTPDGQPKTYSQLSAITLGELMDAGAIRWVEGGAFDPGRFEVDFDKMPAAVDALMQKVGRIKATGDVAAAETLIGRHTSPEGLARIHADVITERVLRFPKASFVYAIKP